MQAYPGQFELDPKDVLKGMQPAAGTLFLQECIEALAQELGVAAPKLPRRRAWPAGLTDREIEVLRLLATGASNRQVAQELVVAKKPSPITWSTFTTVVEAAREQVGGPVSVLAHSYGGLCSLEAALLTDKVNRLILYEPPVPAGQPMYSPGFPDRMQALIDHGELEAALEVFMLEEVKMPERELAVYRQLPMWKERIKIVPTVLREMVIDRTYCFDASRFANLRVPTLLLLGGDSPSLFRQATETLQAALPNNRVVMMPGQQHIAMDTDPELFVREVLQFLGVGR